MAFEVYRTQLVVAFATRRQTSTFYFLVDNVTNVHCYEVASAINTEYFDSSLWPFHFLQMISQSAYLTKMSTRRIRPTPGPSNVLSFSRGDFVGMWLSSPSANFLTANLKWSFANDQTGKHQVRIGPIGQGAVQDDGFFPLFVLAAGAFSNLHRTVHILTGGLVCQGCINHQTSGGTPIESAHLGWPPGRQRNRRWEP